MQRKGKMAIDHKTKKVSVYYQETLQHIDRKAVIRVRLQERFYVKVLPLAHLKRSILYNLYSSHPNLGHLVDSVAGSFTLAMHFSPMTTLESKQLLQNSTVSSLSVSFY